MQLVYDLLFTRFLYRHNKPNVVTRRPHGPSTDPMERVCVYDPEDLRGCPVVPVLDPGLTVYLVVVFLVVTTSVVDGSSLFPEYTRRAPVRHPPADRTVGCLR